MEEFTRIMYGFVDDVMLWARLDDETVLEEVADKLVEKLQRTTEWWEQLLDQY